MISFKNDQQYAVCINKKRYSAPPLLSLFFLQRAHCRSFFKRDNFLTLLGIYKLNRSEIKILVDPNIFASISRIADLKLKYNKFFSSFKINFHIISLK